MHRMLHPSGNYMANLGEIKLALALTTHTRRYHSFFFGSYINIKIYLLHNPCRTKYSAILLRAVEFFFMGF